VFYPTGSPKWAQIFVIPYSTSGRAIAQAVSHWLPTAADRVRARVWQSRICGGQNGAGAGFLRVLRFILPTIFHSTNFSILTITRDRYDRPIHCRSAAWTSYMESTSHYKVKLSLC
jgi:hypothetical protein